MRINTLSHPGHQSVLQEIDYENLGSIYFYTALSVRSELSHMQKILESREVRNDESLSRLIEEHIERTAKQMSDFESYGEEQMIAIKKPPSPTPPPANGGGEIKSIGFYTINPHDRIELRFNNRPVKLRYMQYDNLTKIQTVQIPGKIKYKNGDRLEIRLMVSSKEVSGNFETQNVEWVMHF